MEDQDSGSHARKWESLDIDVLSRIFKSFDIFEKYDVAQVCHTWRLACCDPLLWKTLDLSEMKSNFIKIPIEPYVYVDCQSDKRLTRVLKISLSLSRGNLLTLIFHVNLYVTDDQFRFTAERCPQLKRLVMPAWNRINKESICHAIQKWKDLESLTMPSINNPSYIMEEIAENCKNFSELKIMGRFGRIFATSLATHLPYLKVLSLRCSLLFKDALIIILDRLKHLEVLNISHCFLVEEDPNPSLDGNEGLILKPIDQFILDKGSHLQQFLTCMDDSCHMCQCNRTDEGYMRWYRYKDLWKFDEVKSLAI